MLSGVPNLSFTVGYTNASWTLKADLTAAHVCRILNHMRAHDYRECVPTIDDPEMDRRPLIDLASGYVQRSLRDFPSQGAAPPWRVRQNYALDLLDLRRGGVEDGVLRFAPENDRSAGAVGVARRLRALPGLAARLAVTARPGATRPA
jgi:monooxygenase